MAYLDSKPYSEQHIANIRKMLHAHHDAGQDLYFEFKEGSLERFVESMLELISKT